MCFFIFKFWLPKNLSASCFPVFLVVFGHNLLYWEFKNRYMYSKKPVSVTKKDISDHIYQLIYISLWFYCSGFGCQNSSKMTTFRTLWHNAYLLELFNLFKWLALTLPYNISKSQNRRYITLMLWAFKEKNNLGSTDCQKLSHISHLKE